MDVKGRWKVSKVALPDDDGIRYITAEEIAQMEMSEETEDLINTQKMVLEFTDDQLIVRAIVDDEHRAEVEAEGLTIDDEGMIVLEAHELKIEGDRILLEMGEEDGKPLFIPLEMTEDGEIQYGFAILKRI